MMSYTKKSLKKKANQKTAIRNVFEQLKKENEHLKRTIQTVGGPIAVRNNSKRCEDDDESLEKSADWCKVLYKKQPFTDNYVPDSFLTSLITNKGVVPFRYWSLVRGTAVVTQQCCSVAIFMVIFSLLYNEAITPKTLVILEILLTVLTFGVGMKFGVFTKKLPDVSLPLRLVKLFGFLCVFSPVLHTLTFTISTDTIFALVICLLCIHVAWAEYTPEEREGSLSVNSGLFVSVLLASRLPSPFHSVVLIYFSVGIFGFFPIFRKKLNQNPQSYLKFTFLLFVLTCTLLCFVSSFSVLSFVSFILLLTFICPLWLKYLQRYKFLISGPWDEALPTLRGATCFNN